MAFSSTQEALRSLAEAVWRSNGQDGDFPPDRCPTFRQLDNLITTTAWGSEAREQFANRWHAVEAATDRTFEVSRFAELAHLVWEEAAKGKPDIKHPLVPLILAWQSGPLEVQAVRGADGILRPDAFMPRVAMRRELNSGTDRLDLTPSYGGTDSDGTQVALPGFQNGREKGRVPVLPVNLYDLGVSAGEARGGRGAAPIAARMLVKLAAAPSAFVRHSSRFLTYEITLRDLREALYPPERLDGTTRKPPKVGRMWPRIRESLRVINQDAYIP